ncbi:hypothetical protein [Amycolatopsis thermoflava]|uniref:hypothetical protein n=1 Tax=Amycolatopsis thermoflava TaxID=84480 RepID=UPI0037FDE9BA
MAAGPPASPMTVPFILARLMPGRAGETQRVVHLFPVVEPDLTGRVYAFCRASFRVVDLEDLDGFHGMPCEVCIGRHARQEASRLRQESAEPYRQYIRRTSPVYKEFYDEHHRPSISPDHSVSPELPARSAGRALSAGDPVW